MFVSRERNPRLQNTSTDRSFDVKQKRAKLVYVRPRILGKGFRSWGEYLSTYVHYLLYQLHNSLCFILFLKVSLIYEVFDAFVILSTRISLNID